MKISNSELRTIVADLGIDQPGIDYIHKALEKPSRRVGDHAPANVVGQYFSYKQDLMIQTESHGKELPTILRWEFDNAVYAYRCQPPSIDITRTDKNGKRIKHLYTPDFLVITATEVFVVEVKPESQLLRLKNKYPGQWIQASDKNLTWCFQPAAEAFEQLGISYRVINASLFNKTESANLKTLLRVRAANIVVEPKLYDKCAKQLRRNAWMTIEALRCSVGLSSCDEILSLIESQDIQTDLKRAPLTSATACLVALDKSTLDFYSVEHERFLNSWGSNDVVEVPSKFDCDKAIKKLCYLESGLNDRKFRRYRKKIEDGKDKGLTPLESLLDSRVGNRQPKLKQVVRDFLEQTAESYFANAVRLTEYGSYSNYRIAAKKCHPDHKPASYKTYRRTLDKLNKAKVAKKRMGKRAANSRQVATDIRSREYPSDRPFQKGCIDHTVLDIFVVIAEANGKRYTARPVLTVLVDDATGYWISTGVSLEAPSRRSLAMLFRRCVREYSRLPELLQSDRGAEFRSEYYQALLAHLGCSINWSPPAHARFNSQAERLIKAITHNWIHRRIGNTSKTENRRELTKGYRPEDTAALSLTDLCNELSTFREIYNESTSPQRYQSRKQLFEQGLREFSFSGIPVTYDRKFEIASAVDTKKSEYAINDQNQIKKNGFRYQHPDLEKCRLIKKYLEVREDPENPYVIHCLGPEGWITAETIQAINFNVKPENERLADAVRFNEGGYTRNKILEDANEIIARKSDAHHALYQEKRYLNKLKIGDQNKHDKLFENDKTSFDDVREQPTNSYKTRKRPSDENNGVL